MSNRNKQQNPQYIRLMLRDKLAKALGETRGGARWQLYRVVIELGGSACVELLRQTLHVEQSGGMRTHDGSRKRTRGGVFFLLAKQRMTPEQRAHVFPTPADRRKRKRRKPGAA